MNMRYKFLSLMVCAAAFFSSTAASAEPTANEVIKLFDQKSDITAAWVDGTASGISWANSMLEYDGKATLFCPPDKLAITDDQYVEILREYVKTEKAMSEMPMGFALLSALQETFPCSTEKTPSKTPAPR